MTEQPNQEKPLHGPTNLAGDGQVVAESSAKQGLRGRHMMAVLSISVVLAGLLLLLIWAFFAGPLSSAARSGRTQPAAGSPAPAPTTP